MKHEEITETSPLSQMLRAGSSKNHHDAERRPFMRVFFRYELQRDAYVAWMGRLWFIYDALESTTEQLKDDPIVGRMYTPAILRLPQLERDLKFFLGDEWREQIESSPVTRRYVERIRWAAGESKPRWVAHQWLRYLGMVGGQEILRKILTKSLGASDLGGDDGMDFYRFPQLGEVGPFFVDYHRRLDSMPIDRETRLEVVDEANTAFKLNMDLTDELADDFGITAPAGPSDAEINALKSEA